MARLQFMKALIVRLSSFGDIVQCMPVIGVLKRHCPEAKVDWLVRSDFASLLTPHPGLRKVWSFERKQGLLGLWRLSAELANENYTHIYDAHNNVRSRLLMTFLQLRRMGMRHSFQFARRPKARLQRWLLFKLHIHWLPHPFVGQRSFLAPLKSWNIQTDLPPAPTFYPDPQATLPSLPKSFVALVPSAAWEMKRWPLEKWGQLISQNPQTNFVLLGGPEDTFCADLQQLAPERVTNLAGKLKLNQSCAVLKEASFVIANDTGLLHVADSLARPLIALIGPTAFGYPARPTSFTYETELWCKPCSKDGRGKCKNKEYQKCLQDLSPEKVSEIMSTQLSQGSPC